MSALDAAERLKEDVGDVLDAGRTAVREYGAVGASFRKLLLADVSLARAALIRGLVFLLLCSLMAGTAWVAAMVMLVVGLWQLHLPWLVALTIPLLASAGLAYHAWNTALKAIAFADLDATRRQLSAWFTPVMPIETKSPTGKPNPGPKNPDADKPTVSPEHP
jgi:hypothetical protein